jgi:hypothetical protein
MRDDFLVNLELGSLTVGNETNSHSFRLLLEKYLEHHLSIPKSLLYSQGSGQTPLTSKRSLEETTGYSDVDTGH